MSTNCYIQCLSTTGSNWVQFCANNIPADAQIVCTPGMSGVVNSRTLNFDCSALKLSSNTLANQS